MDNQETKNPLTSNKGELIGEGICDYCGDYATELLAITPNRRRAGFCACEKCAGALWPDVKLPGFN